MLVRLLTPVDAAAYRELHLESLREMPPAFGTLPEEVENVPIGDIALRLVESGSHCVLGAFEGTMMTGIIQLSGYAGAAETHRAFLAGFYVRPEFRRRGFGGRLLATALERARRHESWSHLNLSVVAGQDAAIRLYMSAGFTTYATDRQAFQRDGRFYDEHLMRLELRPA